MEPSENPSVEPIRKEHDHDDEEKELLLSQLPKAQLCNGFDVYQYQGFWCPYVCFHGLITSQKHFQAKHSDIILTSFPKSGTTWLKALTFAIVYRSRYGLQNSPLLTTNPHQLVPFLELNVYMENQPLPDLEHLSKPRIFSTHVPYASLPHSILTSNCLIVYLCRNPLDQFISDWQFIPRLRGLEPSRLDDAFERACCGIQSFGPIWEHVLGYWTASLEQPHKILFLKYEDLKEDLTFCMKRLADFLGCSFSKAEEAKEVIEEISKLCSFDNIKDLEVTKIGKQPDGTKNFLFFRKGVVGDWKNYLAPSMSEHMVKMMEEKFAGSGLTFKLS